VEQYVHDSVRSRLQTERMSLDAQNGQAQRTVESALVKVGPVALAHQADQPGSPHGVKALLQENDVVAQEIVRERWEKRDRRKRKDDERFDELACESSDGTSVGVYGPLAAFSSHGATHSADEPTGADQHHCERRGFWNSQGTPLEPEVVDEKGGGLGLGSESDRDP
jgi:hypothetical protein